MIAPTKASALLGKVSNSAMKGLAHSLAGPFTKVSPSARVTFECNTLREVTIYYECKASLEPVWRIVVYCLRKV